MRISALVRLESDLHFRGISADVVALLQGVVSGRSDIDAVLARPELPEAEGAIRVRARRALRGAPDIPVRMRPDERHLGARDRIAAIGDDLTGQLMLAPVEHEEHLLLSAGGQDDPLHPQARR